jgi:hypothetical protein
MKAPLDDIRKVEDLEDGSSIYEIGAPMQETANDSFYQNLAEDFPEEGLKKLSAFLLDSIEEDNLSRKDWMESVDKIKQYLGFSIEDLKNIPFKEATRTFDTTLANSLIRFYSTTRAELLPQSGPTGFKINGIETEQLLNQGELVKDWINYYLTVVDKAYYSDFERFLLYLGLYGSGFKKVYYDKILGRPISRFIMPQDFIIDSDCTSIIESNRLTHVLHLSKREILFNQQNNVYRDIELPYLKTSEINDNDNDNYLNKIKKDDIDLDVYTKRSLFPIYEVHTYLNLEEYNKKDSFNKKENAIPLPYIVTIDKLSKEVLSIRRNWAEDDEKQERENYFIQYNYLPGFGIYGIGLAHLIGANAITLTKLLRQLVDAGSFKNLPGGLRTKGFKQQNNDLIVGPGEFIEVDTGGVPLSEAFMPLPYSEPSNVLRELRNEIMNQTKELSSTSEMGMLDSKEDIATGTVMAFLETQNRIQSAVLRSIHFSLTQELQLISRIFGKTLGVEQFYSNAQQYQISSADFTDEITIIPVSDPATNSTVQRIMKARATMEIAMQAPELHDLRNVFAMVYKAQGLDTEEINSILKTETEPQEVLPTDPISEYMNILLGKPFKVEVWQNHPAYILILGTATQRPEVQDKPEVLAAIKADITQRQAYQYFIEMQRLLGFELPPLDQLQDPQIQNTIALQLAQRLEETGATTANTEAAPVDPNALLMADIQQKQAETAAKERIANLKAETDIFKAQLDFEKEKAKIESNEDMAKLKSETELTKQEYQNGIY